LEGNGSACQLAVLALRSDGLHQRFKLCHAGCIAGQV
ncbi:MAG: hypothetical protein RLZZ191_998, partial [Pseudomonadota bacterium]